MSTPSPEAAEVLLEAITEGGLTPFDYEADDVMGATDCLQGCQVEPDGTCGHGYQSAAVTAKVI